ncbi:MAG: hydroxymyristoyl-ACP dehydratase [Bacteroidales bacterium]|nr:hydroxymyristoyl-ACP dehydratase [Bacteroidales bacterium]
MLLEGFYTCDDFAQEDGKVTAHLTLNAQHDIFKGHFPEEPIVPGVCTLQMIKAMAERALGRSLRLTQFSQVKYVIPLNPTTHQHLRLELNLTPKENGWSLGAEVLSGDELAVKIKSAMLTAE